MPCRFNGDETDKQPDEYAFFTGSYIILSNDVIRVIDKSAEELLLWQHFACN
jgi:hypothetical protein